MIGIFGGTFDPIHFGHLRTVDKVQRTIGLAQVLFVPAASPPHRQQPMASPQQRLEMLRLATGEYPNFSIDARELARQSPSYTVVTLAAIHAEHLKQTLCLIIGMDAFLSLPSWHRWQELFSYAHIVVMRRPGWSYADSSSIWCQQQVCHDKMELRQRPAGCVFIVDVDPVAIAATEIRRRIAGGEDPSRLLPNTVWNYIKTNSLYGYRKRNH